MPARLQMVSVLWLLGALAAHGDEPFRQFIEAEDCRLDTFTVGNNPLGSYVGDRFAYHIGDAPFRATLTAPLHCPPAPVPPRSSSAATAATAGRARGS